MGGVVGLGAFRGFGFWWFGVVEIDALSDVEVRCLGLEWIPGGHWWGV